MDFEERRRGPRIAYFEPVVAYAGQQRLSCRSLDLGAGGIALRAPFEADPPEGLVRLNLKLDAGQTVVVDAQVIDYGRGADWQLFWNLCFCQVPPPIRHRIAAYVRGQARRALRDRRQDLD